MSSRPQAFDAALCAALALEWQHSLTGSRVERVAMSSPHRVDFSFFGRGHHGRITFSLRPSAARAHPAADAPPNLPVPPVFCQYLRRHLGGRRLEEVSAVPFERRLALRFSGTNDFGDPVSNLLWFEGFGSRPNLVLVNEEGVVMAAFRHVAADRPEDRSLLPGLPYVEPRRSSKVDPREVTGSLLAHRLQSATAGDGLAGLVVSHVAGFSPILAREACARAGVAMDERPSGLSSGGCERMAAAIRDLVPNLLGQANDPTLVRAKDGDVIGVLPVRPVQYGDPSHVATLESFPSIGLALERFYFLAQERERVEEWRSRLRKVLRTRRERVGLRLSRQDAEDREGREDLALGHRAEILLAYQAQVPPGTAHIEFPDWLADQTMVSFELDPALTPVEQAETWFRRYRRAERRRSFLAPQLAQGRTLLGHLQSLEDTVERAKDRETLAWAEEEMRRFGFVPNSSPPAKLRSGKAKRPHKNTRAAHAIPPFHPLRFVTQGGIDVWVGRSGLENDRLSLREASDSDLWFHVAEGPGAHVVLRPSAGQSVSEQDCEDAAVLAAFHSPQRRSSHVHVDVCPVRRLRKPPGSPPGFLLYDRSSAFSVTPDEARVSALRRSLADEAASSSVE